MREYNLKKHCKLNYGERQDGFVGIISENNEVNVYFPVGFEISESDKEIRKDILLLLNSIAASTGKRDSVLKDSNDENAGGYPIQAYLFIIRNFYERGYYQETETEHTLSGQGKVNWGKTIKSQKASIQDNDVFYLKLVRKRNVLNENEMITQIHKFCVYESFYRAGWLFTSFLPPVPEIKFNKKLFLSVLNEKLSRTYNDSTRELLKNMIRIVEETSDVEKAEEYRFGTYEFEYVWEYLIDCVYGISNKSDYFPKTTWKLPDTTYDNSHLEPDTIMLNNGDIFVIDAKYYRYGESRNPAHLPESTSINKQITYGEYVAEAKKIKQKHGDKYKVYNAFIMPYNKVKWNAPDTLTTIGSAVSSWKSGDKEYENILGVLVDAKQLMKMGTHKNQAEIQKLAECITSFFDKKSDDNG